MIRLDDILEKVSGRFGDKDIALLQKATVFSARAHKGQVRRSGEPYLSHPLEVAAQLADMNLDATALTAGLLHDVLEDTDVTAAELRETFGKDIAALVEGRDENQPGAGILAGAPAGRNDPQDHPGHDRRHAGHFHQAGRPSPQSPDLEIPPGGGPETDRRGNHGDLRARSPTASGWAGSRRSWRTWPSATSNPRNISGWPRCSSPGGKRPSSPWPRSGGPSERKIVGEPDPGRNRRPDQAAVQRLAEDEDAENRIRPGLRLHGPPRHHRLGPELLPGSRASFIRTGRPFPAGSAISSPCPSPTSTRPCTRPS